MIDVVYFDDPQYDISGHGMLFRLLGQQARRRPAYHRPDVLLLVGAIVVFAFGFFFYRYAVPFFICACFAMPLTVFMLAYHKTAKLLENGFLFHMLLTPQPFRSLYEDLRDHLLELAMPAVYVFVLYPVHLFLGRFWNPHDPAILLAALMVVAVCVLVVRYIVQNQIYREPLTFMEGCVLILLPPVFLAILLPLLMRLACFFAVDWGVRLALEGCRVPTIRLSSPIKVFLTSISIMLFFHLLVLTGYFALLTLPALFYFLRSRMSDEVDEFADRAMERIVGRC